MIDRYRLILLLSCAGVLLGAVLWWFRSPGGDATGRALPGLTQPGPPSSVRPSVVLISLDTLRADHLGCYGYPRPTSPNLDRFARQAVLFKNCWAQSPWTLPSHMSLLTSMLPATNGVDSINKVLPAHIPTLARQFQEEGYHTAALVNNGQMRAHWGLARGFDSWREFEVDRPEGACDHITREALTWLQQRPTGKPFFLFLHYYDPHDPYEAPERFRKKLGTSLTGSQARKLCFRHRFPDSNLTNRALLADLKAAYDADIAWLDDELGKLLAALPNEALVVLFSDHGEAFEEHGWTLHGATLFSEELHVPLLVRLPGGAFGGTVVKDPVMLLDVAPTLLGQCGIRPPVSFQGIDLSPTWRGQRLPPRLIPAETKASLEGRYCLSVMLHPLKGIYSLLDGRFDVYRLPDEQNPLPESEKVAREALLRPLRQWLESEQFWLLHAVGAGEHEVTVTLPHTSLGLFILGRLDPERDHFDIDDQQRRLYWRSYLGKEGLPKSLLLQLATSGTNTPGSGANAAGPVGFQIDYRLNGQSVPTRVYLGKEGRPPEKLPALLSAKLEPVSPFLKGPFRSDRPGLHVLRHAGPAAGTRPGVVQPLDVETLRQLRALGYVN